MTELRELIEKVDLEGIRKLLLLHPELVNAGIALGSQDSRSAHPLHRICDGVYHKLYTDLDARSMAELFMQFGADVNGVDLAENQDSPLTAAASLAADLTGIYYIDNGANLSHAGCHGGTALHWAAWCGRDILVKRLIEAGAPLEQRCKDFYSTPLFWAIHGYKFEGNSNGHYVACARLLVEAGAVKDTRNIDKLHVLELLGESDVALRSMLL